MASYESFASGSLKLKGVSDHKIKKKKKKKNKEAQEILDKVAAAEAAESEAKHVVYDRRTKAEIAFQKTKEKRHAKEIIEKASKTHKERIMVRAFIQDMEEFNDFNSHLDTLTEHFDIPKVSWTK